MSSIKLDGLTLASTANSAISIGSNVTFAKRLSSYQWDSWNPSNISGAFTDASSSGNTDDSDYTTMSNSSGTLTITFDVAGVYQVSLYYATGNSATLTYQSWQTDFGGSATRRHRPMSPWGPNPSVGGQISASQTFLVSATASQTLTILPQFRVHSSANGAATSNFTAYANCCVLYCGV